MSVCLGTRVVGIDYKEAQGDPLRVMGMFYIFILVVATRVYTFIKTDPTVHLKWMHFIVCKLYFNKIDLKNLEDWLKSIYEPLDLGIPSPPQNSQTLFLPTSTEDFSFILWSWLNRGSL